MDTTALSTQAPLSTTAIEVAVNRVCEGATLDEIADAMLKVDSIVRIAKEFKAEFDRRMLEFVELNGLTTVGTVDYWAGFAKTTKCRNNAACLDAIIQMSGGDLEATAQYLGSQPFKYGKATKDLLGDEWDKHFEVIETPKLEDNKPKKSLQSIDTKWIR